MDRGVWWATVYGVTTLWGCQRVRHDSDYHLLTNLTIMGFPGGSVVKNPLANAGDEGLIPGWGRSPGEGNGTPLQYSSLGNPMDRGAWQAMVYGVTKESNMT